MGNTASSPRSLPPGMKKAMTCFDHCEITVLRQTFKDLCAISGKGTSVDKETFLQYFPLPGLLGERLFAVFDTKRSGKVDFEEFVCGLAVTCRGDWDQKVDFIFSLYDVHGTGAVSREELTALLNHVPKSVMNVGRALQPYGGARAIGGTPMSRAASAGSPPSLQPPAQRHAAGPESNGIGGSGEGGGGADGIVRSVSSGGGGGSVRNGLMRGVSEPCVRSDEELGVGSMHGRRARYHHHYAEFTNSDIVDQAFDECDIDKDGKLSLSEFRMWIKRTPAVKRFLQSVFPYDEHRDYRGDTKELPFIHNHADDATPQGSPGGGGRRGSGEREGGALAAGSREEALSLLQRAQGLLTEGEERAAIAKVLTTLQGAAAASAAAAAAGAAEGGENGGQGDKQAPLEQPPAAPSYDDLPSMSKHRHSIKIQTSVARKGFLSKRGQRTKQWQRRWYMLVGNCIYYYRNEQDRTPRGVIFLIGSFIEPLREEESEKTGHWGLDIVRSQEQGVRRCLYASSKSERDAWVRDLRRASEVIPIEEDFEIGEELGKGQFSRVCLCVNKRTLERKAVKIIEKDTMDAEERELLRAEIAIMKLVEHPNIIAMEAVYESRQHIFIVMELHSGGELFDRINGRPRLTEDEAFCVIYPLIESVAYLHEMGIVHRDLKPENILCGQKMGDIKIADFGLSKLVLPDEIMKMPCGTLSYVAPEVLTLNGYGREADMWSVGTIMYLLLRGRLPFDADGDSRGKIIERTIHGTIDTEDATWQALSEDARHLMLGLLNKDIKRRTSAKEALVHPWITARVDRMAEDPAAFDL